MAAMRQHLARLIWASSLAGCSLIYNPSNLPDRTGDGGPDAPPIDAPTDTPIADANPALLQLEAVKSPNLLEGAGQSGSQPQVLVVYGMHMLKTATVAIAPTTANANVTIQVTNVSIADDGNSFAALVRAGYMPTVNESTIDLTITVTQPGADPKTLPWKLQALDELTTTGGAVTVPATNKLYSRVNVNGDIDFTAGQGRAIVKAVGSINITGRISANANPTTRVAGAGGCAGGGGNADGQCFGGGKSGGGGAGFAATGGDGAANTGGPISGDELVKIYDGSGAAMNKGAGGGGAEGAGGGGGGTIELTAGGDVMLGTVQANAAGGAGGITLGAGGGAGGVLVVRSGAALTHPTAVSLAGGAGGGGLTAGGNGSIGRWRFDAATVTNAPPAASATTPAPRRGPMFVRPTNPIFEINKPSLMVAGKSGDAIQLIALYPDGTSDTKTATMTSDLYPVVPPTLAIGLNTVCVVVPGGNFANDEAKNCIELAFIP